MPELLAHEEFHMLQLKSTSYMEEKNCFSSFNTGNRILLSLQSNFPAFQICFQLLDFLREHFLPDLFYYFMGPSSHYVKFSTQMSLK